VRRSLETGVHSGEALDFSRGVVHLSKQSNNNMNKLELTEIIARKNNISKTLASEILSTITETIVEEVSKDGKVVLVGFGTFCQYKRQARNARNPLTREIIRVPGSSRPKFIPGSAFKKIVDPSFEENCRKASKG